MSEATATNEATVRKGRRTLLLIALVAVAPVVASYAAYYWFPRDKHVNYGELLATRPATDVGGAYLDGRPFRMSDLRGKWLVVAAAPAACDGDCAKALYATRQARTMQGREMERIVRVWFVTDDATPDAALLAQHPDLVAVRVTPAAIAAWGADGHRIVAVDPLGNLVLAYPRDPDIKGVARDLTRLLKASRIG
ncbi:MAG: cytochrome c oxidase subunit I [Burkholderiales bacterium]